MLENPGSDLDDDDNGFQFRRGGESTGMEDGTAVEDEWSHIAAVFNREHPDPGRRLILYYNGSIDDDSGDDDLNPADDDSPVAIGFGLESDGNFANAGHFFYGMIDELRVYDRALNPAEFLLTPGPEWASNPRPGHGQVDVDPNDPKNPGTKADKHKVYLSTDFDDVNNGAAEAYLGEYDTNEVNDFTLGYGRTYYWRIDEVNTGVSGSPWVGVVWRFTTTFQIIDEHLILWYPFDEDSGRIATDYSGYGKHGDFDLDRPTPAWEPAGGRFGGCLAFDDDTSIDVPSDVLDRVTDGITLSVWLYGLPQSGDNLVMQAGEDDDDNDYFLEVRVPDDEDDIYSVYWRAGNDSNDELRWEVDTVGFEGDWHHFAFVKDESADKMYIYLDGDVGWWKPGGTISSLANIVNQDFKIGAEVDEDDDYVGKMDDFRVYDLAKSETEIEELYRGGDLASAWGPSPYDGQADAPRDANLAWNAGDYADSHDVYFGTDYAAVRDANTSVTLGVYRGNQAGTVNDIEILDLDTWYFWRIDEVNDACDASPWTGKVWKFKVADYIILDDFESYESDSHLRSTWVDAHTQLIRTGAVLYRANYGVLYPAHGGDKIMRYGYHTDYGDGLYDVPYAEAWLPLEKIGAKNWTDSGVSALTLFFYGLPANDANGTEQMYVGIQDENAKYAEVRYGDYERLEEEDTNDLKEPEWHEWFIALPDFNDSNYAAVPNNIDLTDVNRLVIGFGNRRNPQVGGSGEVRFDDIRLNLPVCRPEIIKPVADFTGPRGRPDCVVDLADIGYVADEWLRSDANLVDIMEEPCDANLLGHWKLDEDPCDSSSYNHYGYMDGDGNNYSWVTGHDGEVSNPAIEFTDTSRLLVPDDNNTPALRPEYRVSVSAWAYSKGQSDSARVVVKGADNKETYNIEIDNDDDFTFYVRDANGNIYDVSTQVSQDEWLHLAGTYDGNTVKCYLNAELKETKDANFVVVKGWTLSQDVNGLAIGNRSDDTDRQFIGIIDDVRVYDYDLSAGELAWLATDGTGLTKLTSPANLYDLEPPGEKAVNFRDIALLIAEHWLEEKKWP
jgi:hypothetical protein